jgi:hypothetical protein
MSLSADSAGLLVKPDLARSQMDAETAPPPTGGPTTGPTPGGDGATGPAAGTVPKPPVLVQPKRFHGTVALDPTRVGRDSSRIAEEVIAHLVGLVGSTVTVTLEIEAEIPAGAPDNVVRTVTENSRTLKFTQQGFEKD